MTPQSFQFRPRRMWADVDDLVLRLLELPSPEREQAIELLLRSVYGVEAR